MKKKKAPRPRSGSPRSPTRKPEAPSRRKGAEDPYRSLMDNLPLGIAILCEGKVVFCNPALCTLCGYTREELLAMNEEQAAAVIHPEDRSRVLSAMENRLSGKALVPGQLLRSVKKTGEVQWLETLSRRTEFKGKPALEISFMDVTERIVAEESYHSLVENSIQGFAIIQEGRIVFCNEALLKMSGFTREETYGMTPEDVIATVHPEDRSRVMSAMGEILAGGNTPPGQQIRIINKQGITKWVEVLAARTAYNSRPAFQISYVDITERREAEAGLRESESRFRELVENAPVAIWVSRPGEVVYRNRAFARMFGYENDDELAGMESSDLVVPRFRQEMTERALLRSHRSQEETVFEGVGLRKDGSEFPFRSAATVLNFADGPATVAFVSDLTAQKESDRKLEDSRLRLRNLASHLLSAREAERKSVAREIHDELGQILTALKMDLRWVEKRIFSSQLPILDKIRGTTGLADQAIDIVHRIASNLRPVMLDDLGLPAAIEWLGGEFSRHTGISCAMKVTFHESFIGGTRATALFRIVQESLNNVGRHSHASHVSVLLREANGLLEIRIEDNGIGITAEQASGSTSFGLIGMQERVEGLGGKLRVHGREGKGTTVHVTVPLAAGGMPE